MRPARENLYYSSCSTPQFCCTRRKLNGHCRSRVLGSSLPPLLLVLVVLLLHFGLNDLLQQPARPAVSACRRDLKQPPALWSERETERQTDTERGTDRQSERETDLLSSGFFSTPSPVQAPGKFAVSYPQLAASAASFSDCSHNKTGVGATVASAGARLSRLTDRLSERTYHLHSRWRD